MKKLIILVSFVFLLSCNTTKSQSDLKLLESYSLNIQEPSGITFYENHLYIVSDYNGMVYKTNLKGDILDKIQIETTDNEGVCFDEKGNLCVVNETKRNLLKNSLKGKLLNKIEIKGKQKHKNRGLEGVCFSKSEKCFFVVNEKTPKQLLKISSKGKIKEKFKINEIDDLSGICFDAITNSLWIVSDESKAILQLNLKGEIKQKFKINIVKAEGVTLINDIIYIVSDSENRLYTFQKPKLQ